MKYSLLYRLGATPWERYPRFAAGSIGAMLDREEADRPRPLGRALDLGCGRGHYTRLLARRGWDALGIDIVSTAIVAATRAGGPGTTFRVADVTTLESADLGTFDLFLDVGCFQGLGGEQRVAEGRGVTALANPGATLLMLAFQPTLLRILTEGVARAEVEAALPGWQMLSAEPAETRGLGWPMNRTSPQWYRFRKAAVGHSE